jgi:murein DD-endopeptidase MepM/ murein hydrolase activator NlpD
VLLRHWTLLVVSDTETSVRQYRLSREAVQIVTAVVLFAVSAVSSIGTAYVVKHRQPTQTVRLEKKNQLLKSELKDIQTQIASLNAHLEVLTQQDEHFRLVAGLEPLNADIKRVGIGGPASEPVEQSALRSLDHAAADLAAATANKVDELLRRARLLSFSWREARDTLEIKNERMASTPSIIPTDGMLTSTFSKSRWHPILDRPRPHEGVDISAPIGTPIVAAAKGVIRTAGFEDDYGYMVEIDHGFGLSTRYAHASKILVRVGQSVKRGERIALIGATGLAVGPHLHYEVLVNGRPANPRKFFFDLDAIAD